MARHVTTQHRVADAAIERLRELRDIAQALKALGDENLGLQKYNEELLLDLHEAELAVERMEQEGASALAELREAIADFDRGIIERDELITLGREMDS